MPADIILFPNRTAFVDTAVAEHSSASEVATPLAVPTNPLAATWETTPVIFPHPPADVFLTCKNELDLHEILLVPVHPTEDPDPTNYVQNIAREMLTVSGRPVFGWRIRTSPLFVVAEFYAMLKTDTGLVDVTPNTRGESYVVFAPDYDIPPDYDYLDRLGTRRFPTYEAPTRRQRVAAEIAAMPVRKAASERRRAIDLGLTLEDIVSLNLVPDALATSLDLYLECCEELEALTMAAVDGREALDFERFDSLLRRKAALQNFVDDAYADYQAARAPQKRRGR